MFPSGDPSGLTDLMQGSLQASQANFGLGVANLATQGALSLGQFGYQLYSDYQSRKMYNEQLDWQKQAFRENMDWQKHVANNSYSMRMADMARAGLNPVLAAGGNPVSTPVVSAGGPAVPRGGDSPRSMGVAPRLDYSQVALAADLDLKTRSLEVEQRESLSRIAENLSRASYYSRQQFLDKQDLESLNAAAVSEKKAAAALSDSTRTLVHPAHAADSYAQAGLAAANKATADLLRVPTLENLKAKTASLDLDNALKRIDLSYKDDFKSIERKFLQQNVVLRDLEIQQNTLERAITEYKLYSYREFGGVSTDHARISAFVNRHFSYLDNNGKKVLEFLMIGSGQLNQLAKDVSGSVKNLK